jgi:hypothetical protein
MAHCTIHAYDSRIDDCILIHTQDPASLSKVKLPDGTWLPCDQVAGSTKATLTVNGVDADGHIDYTSFCGGSHMDSWTVEHVAADPMQIDVTGTAITINVGATPADAGTVINFVNDKTNWPDPGRPKLTAAAPGSGASATQAVAAANLSGGLDDGTTIMPHPGVNMLIVRVEEI